MSEIAPEEMDGDVVVVTSRPAQGGERSFRIETDEEVEAGEDVDARSLPDGLRHEGELVNHMKRRGFRLTMVGGGSRSDEVRRFYFRQEGPAGR